MYMLLYMSLPQSDTNGDKVLDSMELQALFYNEVRPYATCSTVSSGCV